MDRFIVGTGRCGSTLLSRMLAEHPGALSIFEFFNGLDAARRFSPEPIDGSVFAELISAEQPFVTAVLRRGYPVAEITYPFSGVSGGDDGPESSGRGRFAINEPLPWILVSTLPRLSDDPDVLFDAVMAFARGLATRPFVAHCRCLFDWLVGRMGREFWLERSGSSIDYLAGLDEQFPNARFLHIHRDGREAALSMREHHAYRLPISLMYGAPTDSGVPLAELGPLDLHAAPTGEDPISQVLASRPAAEYFGRYWNDQIHRGADAREHIDADRFAEVRFEDLVARPRPELERIAVFFGIDAGSDEWIERGAALVVGQPRARVGDLGSEERTALDEACRPGLEILGRVGS